MKLQFYWHPGSWCRPEEWYFDFYQPVCGKGCRVIECGFFTVTVLRKDCKG